ncbi:Neural proliferation differentiation and control protein 1-like protein [Leptotrombidium deliense]|uniref:Neural proliferation differentiation and control protein 1-like protein n=1 Tax=Leptotrombidium deliense TaxID=299467 RepID=A0A443SV15_9ACAR|nr:Neural proliferation differentiation and control protein 1-like protein [Leptotrombidium deliense]
MLVSVCLAINSENNSGLRSKFPPQRNRFRNNRLIYTPDSYQGVNQQRDISFPVFYRRSYNTDSFGYRRRHSPTQYSDNDGIGVKSPSGAFDSRIQDREVVRDENYLDARALNSAKQSSNDDSERKKKVDSNDNYVLLKASSLEANEDRRGPISLNGDVVRGATTFGDVYFVAIVAGCSAAAIIGVIGAGYCFYKFQQHSKAAADVDYPAYGVVGPATKENTNSTSLSPSGDRKLAQSAQMYHYHHQKQQMIASEKAATSRHTSASDVDSDEENEEGDYTVYECPGLAATGEMEVKNPLFQDDVTPVSSPSVVGNAKEK